MATWPPTVDDFKAKFTREFVYSDGFDAVRDADIQRGLDEAAPHFNQSLFGTPADQTSAYLFVAAHCMVMNIQTAGGLSAVNRGRGTRNVGEGVTVSKGVGQANVTYQVPPPRVADSPTLLYFFQTTFGQRFIQLVSPRLIGNMAVVCGPNDNLSMSQE